eukprot:COSAG02_NODE_732_length_17973_cov_6.920275_7_plen_48_part_00
MGVQCPYFYWDMPQRDYGWQTSCGHWYTLISTLTLPNRVGTAYGFFG